MQMIRTLRVSVLALAGAMLMAAAGSQAADTATVNGVTIPQSRFDLLLQQATKQQQDTPELRNAIRDRLIDYEVVAQAAVSLGLDKNPDLAARLDMQRQQALVDAFAQDYLRSHPISEDALQLEYTRVKAQLSGQSEFKVRHILLKTQDDAIHVIDQLDKGSSFERLAKEKSQDAGTKNQGGDLGNWLPQNLPPNVIPAAFMDAVKKLKKGQYTEVPVQTTFGWHVIRVDDVRPVTVPGYDAIKPQLQQELQNAELKTAVENLRAKAKIED